MKKTNKQFLNETLQHTFAGLFALFGVYLCSIGEWGILFAIFMAGTFIALPLLLAILVLQSFFSSGK